MFEREDWRYAEDRDAEDQEMRSQMETLYEIARTVNSSLDLGEVLQLIVQSATQVIPDVKASSIRLLDETGQRLQISAAYGLSQAYLDKGPVEVEKSHVDREALQGAIVSVLDAARDSRVQYPEESRKEGIRSVLCAPMSVKNKVIGVIRIYCPMKRLFTDEEVRMLSYLTHLGAIAIENARAYRQLEELEKAKSDMMYTVAHQLKTPLATVQSLVVVILEGYAGDVESKLASLLGTTVRRIRGLIGLVDDLLQLSLASSQIMHPEMERVDLREAIQDVVDVLSPKAQRKNLNLVVDLPSATPTLRMDPEELADVLTNLIDNAIKYTPEGGQVTVRTAEAEDGLTRVEVADTGIGIPSEEAARVFGEFYRTRGARRMEQEGTGLGLPIVKRIVERSGGHIQLDSTPGIGSTFNVYLPIDV